MKTNKLTIILIIIIVILGSYIIYDKVHDNKKTINELNEEVTIKEEINLEYVNIYLATDGLAYIVPLKDEEIEDIKIEKNLKENLKTLYNRSFFYDLYVDNQKIRGFRVKLTSKINNIINVKNQNNEYVLFLKEDNSVGLFNYANYYENLDTSVYDNYFKNVKEIKNNKIIYLDGKEETFTVK